MQVEKFQGPNPVTGKYVLTARNQNLVFSLPLVGSVIGGLLASPMNFHLGRKWPLIVAYIISVGGGLLQVFAPNFGAFVGGRSINSVALGIINATAPLYISEVLIVYRLFDVQSRLSLLLGGSHLYTRKICQFNEHFESNGWRGRYSGGIQNGKDPWDSIVPDPNGCTVCSACASSFPNSVSSRKSTMAGWEGKYSRRSTQSTEITWVQRRRG